MPGTDGYELLRRIRAGSHAAMPAIAVTAFARPEDRDRTLAAGFQGHLPKPINPGQLVQMLARLVELTPPPDEKGAVRSSKDSEAQPG